MAKSLRIELYTDIICPWCLIGERRLDNVLSTGFDGVDIDIEHHPVLLLPDLPDEGVETLSYFRSRFGEIDPRSMWERPQAEARKAGITIDLSKQTMLYPTVGAHTLIRNARARGTQHALASALTRAYFLDAARISDAAILSDIAVQYEFDRNEAIHLLSSDEERRATMEAAAASARRGVRSVPTFVINGRPAQPLDEAAIAAALSYEMA